MIDSHATRTIAARGSQRVIACTGSECENGQGRVLAALRREAGAIGHVKPLRFPALAVRVEHRGRGVASHPRRAGFVDGEARRRGRLVNLVECYAGQLSKLPQCCNLLARARLIPAFCWAAWATDHYNWDARRIS